MVKDVYNYLNLIELDDKLYFFCFLFGDLFYFLICELGRIGFVYKCFVDFIFLNKKFFKKYYVLKYNGYV